MNMNGEKNRQVYEAWEQPLEFCPVVVSSSMHIWSEEGIRILQYHLLTSLYRLPDDSSFSN
jgi:hypothetical protein